MTTGQLAVKYGVPMPETCKELNWQGETHFYWVYYEGEYHLHNENSLFHAKLLLEKAKMYKEFYNENMQEFREDKNNLGAKSNARLDQGKFSAYCEILVHCFATDTSEIYEPNYLFENGEFEVQIPAPQMHEIAIFLEDKLPTLRLCLEHKSEHLYTIDEVTNEVDFCVNVCRSNYAEAYAQIYLEFKNEGVI